MAYLFIQFLLAPKGSIWQSMVDKPFLHYNYVAKTMKKKTKKDCPLVAKNNV